MIHREGYKILVGFGLLVLLVLYVLATLVGVSSWVFCIGLLFCVLFYAIILQFFRNPKPITVVNPHHVLAPCDGKVVVIEKVLEPEFLGKECIQLSIFMSPFNVHVNRNPIAGTVEYFKYHKGKYLVAWHPKSSTENERTTYVINHESGRQILLRQIAGALAKRIRWYVKEGDAVEQGHEFGFIKFGSRVDVFLPTDAQVLVTLGQKTKAGETIVASW